MNFFKGIAAVLCFQFLLLGSGPAEEKNVLHQVSTIDALLSGVFEGEADFKALKQKGDFGIGTFNDLDGEMLAVDGHFYQIKSDGTVVPADDGMKTPFSSITFFNSSWSFQLKESATYIDFASKLDALLLTQNLIYAIRIDGVFEYIKTRSVPKQKKPYPPLAEVVKAQPIFEFHKIRGTLVGFRFPKYMKGLNVEGYHFHFITQDRKGGGHVLDWKIENVEAKIAEISRFEMELPRDDAFYHADLGRDREIELAAVEQSK